MSKLYARIKFLCEKRDLSLSAMCSAAGVSSGLLSDLKAGRRKSIQVETAQKIADALAVPVGALFRADIMDTTDLDPDSQPGLFTYRGKNFNHLTLEEIYEAEKNFSEFILEALRERGVLKGALNKNSVNIIGEGFEITALTPEEAELMAKTAAAIGSEIIRLRRQKEQHDQPSEQK